MLPSSPLATSMIVVGTLLTSCVAHPRMASAPPLSVPEVVQVGAASYLSDSLAGHRTASGIRFDPRRMMAAHRTLPFGTRVRVTNLANGRHVVVTIVDRGPFRAGRILDVSPHAARLLGFHRAGVARVRLEVMRLPDEAVSDPR